MTRIEEFVVGDQPHLEVALGAGHIEVHANTNGLVRVSIDAPDHDGFEVHQIGDTVTIREESRWRSRNRRVRILVEAPPDSDVTAEAGSAHVTTRGRLRVLRSRLASGDLDIAEVERLDASSGSGNVRVAGVTGDARVGTASGDVSLGTTDGQLEASTASGDVTVRGVGGTLEVSTASGDVTIDRADGDAATVKTLSGDIRIGLPSGIRVEPDISTLSGSVKLPTPADVSSAEPRRTVRVRLRSMSGDIRVDRAT